MAETNSDNSEDDFLVQDEVADADEAADEGNLQISGDQKFVLEKADRSLIELHRWHKKGRIIVDPEWQRKYVWNQNQASKLIESFLFDIPVPVIYLAKTGDNNYEFVDGLQRLTSVFDFMDNKFKLNALELIPEISFKHFKDIGGYYQSKLEDSILRSFEMSSNSSDMRFIVFERINTGSVKLNDMEIRNCLFRGPVNDLLKELSDSDDFKSAVNQKRHKDRMQNQALVLRFLAFYERTYLKCDKGLKKFLNEFLDTYRNAGDDKIEEYRKAFGKSVRASLTIFGNNSFRLKNDKTKLGSKSVGEWSSRPNAAIFQVIATSFAQYDLRDLTLAADAIYEEYVDLISTDKDWVDRVRRATGETTRLRYSFETWNSRLSSVMSSNTPRNGERLFSRNLKKEMFLSNPVCGICGQRISLIDDAAMDHDKQYWKGGQTIPENAQLVHRTCNFAKG